MRKATFLLGFVALSLPITICAEGQEPQRVMPWEEKKEFDVAVGEAQILHSGDLSEFQLIMCRFSIDEFRTASDIFASVAVMFTSAAPQDYDVLSYLARVAAYRFEKDDGWRYEFTLTSPDKRNSRIVAHTGKTELVLPLMLLKGKKAKVTYFVGDGDVDVSQIHVSDFPLTSWQIVAIGVKGESRCAFEK